jgi:monomeric isocitrate dehydrogenase
VIAPTTGSAPKNVRLFVNEPHLSFEDAGDAIPAQAVTLTEEDLVKEGNNVLKIPLKLIKYPTGSSRSFAVGFPYES